MPTTAFRFVHASDFHLERPLMGVPDVPDHLRDLFLDAPYAAARQVFDAALVEDAAFVVLSGDILQPAGTGPRGPLFLAEQFSRLAARGIGVYWLGGTVDPPDAWPAAVKLPPNVSMFPCHNVGQVGNLPPPRQIGNLPHAWQVGNLPHVAVARGNAGPIARLLGISCDRQLGALHPGGLPADPAGLYTIAVAHGEVDAAALQSPAVHYSALGGRHDRATPQSGPPFIHYCGSPQGRRPQESGVHGCTLVQVDEQQHARTSLIPTDAARWLGERVLVDETTSREDLQSRLRQRMHALLEAAPTVALLISWTVAGRGPLAVQMRRGHLAADLLNSLRSEYGHRSPAAWSVSLEAEVAETLPPEWYEQETIRGDYLRALRQMQVNAEEPLGLEEYVAEAHLAGSLAAQLAPADKAARDRTLREAALLGVELLSGEEPHA